MGKQHRDEETQAHKIINSIKILHLDNNNKAVVALQSWPFVISALAFLFGIWYISLFFPFFFFLSDVTTSSGC